MSTVLHLRSLFPVAEGPLTGIGRPSTVVLKIDEFRRLCASHHLRNDRDIAHALGIQHSTAWRTGTGATGPSERFIAGALRAFDGICFTDLFECVDYEKGARRSA